ncbi:MAG: hypothetical protein IPJ54_11065 [Saprospiraceae bacterium]|nr:hypothetical protein [Saprospiraceae bacterium]
MQKFKALCPILVVFITLNISCKEHKNESIKVTYGWENRLYTSRLPMNCSDDHLAVYDENDAYGFRKEEYEIIIRNAKELGYKEFTFVIKIHPQENIPWESFHRMSFCMDGKEFVGRGIPHLSSSLPPACHFYYQLNEKILFKSGIAMR